MLLTIHVAAGGIAMMLGFAALFSRKGSATHRRSGQFFAVSILGMAISASLLGLRDPTRDGDLVPALMTAYFVGTAVATIRSSSPWSKRVSFLATAMAVVIALALIASGTQGIASPLLTPGGVPARTIGVMSLVLATILVVAVLPEPFPSASMRALPIVIIFGAMTCWLWRVRSRAP